MISFPCCFVNEPLVLIIPCALLLSSFTIQTALFYDVRGDGLQLGKIRVTLFDKASTLA